MKSNNLPDYTNKGFNSFNSLGAVLGMKKEEKNQVQFGIFKEHVECTNSLIEEHTGLKTEIQHYIIMNGLTAQQIERDEYVKELSERMIKIVGDIRTLFSNRLLGIFDVVK